MQANQQFFASGSRALSGLQPIPTPPATRGATTGSEVYSASQQQQAQRTSTGGYGSTSTGGGGYTGKTSPAAYDVPTVPFSAMTMGSTGAGGGGSSARGVVTSTDARPAPPLSGRTFSSSSSNITAGAVGSSAGRIRPGNPFGGISGAASTSVTSSLLPLQQQSSSRPYSSTHSLGGAAGAGAAAAGGSDLLFGGPSPSSANVAAGTTDRVKALYAYAPNGADEMELRAGENEPRG